MALYNTSINQNGLKFLQQQKDLLSALAYDLQRDTTYELKLMALRLLQSLTYDIPNETVLKDIMKEVCKADLCKSIVSRLGAWNVSVYVAQHIHFLFKFLSMMIMSQNGA
jgi:hypothetical protein